MKTNVLYCSNSHMLQGKGDDPKAKSSDGVWPCTQRGAIQSRTQTHVVMTTQMLTAPILSYPMLFPLLLKYVLKHF